MAYKPKNKRLPRPPRQIIPLDQVQSPQPPNPSEPSSTSSEPSEVLEVVVEGHVPEPGSLKSKFLDKLRDITSGDDEQPEAEPKKYGYNNKKKQKEEVANLILTIFVVAAAAWPVPEEVKPNKDEMALVANHMTSILARHNLLLGKLSGDALDVVGIIAAGAAWYTRAAPELRRLRGSGDGGGGGRSSLPPSKQTPPPASEVTEPVSPISRMDAATGQWLEDALKKSEGEE